MPTLEERMQQLAAARQQQGATVPDASTPDAAPAEMSLEDRMKRLAATRDTAPVVPPPPTAAPTSGTSAQPEGFWKKAWKQIDPFAAVKGLFDARAQIAKAREEFNRANPNASFIDRQLFEGKLLKDMAVGMGMSVVDLIKEVGSDIGSGNYAGAAGTVTGVVAPALVGAGIKRAFPKKLKLTAAGRRERDLEAARRNAQEVADAAARQAHGAKIAQAQQAQAAAASQYQAVRSTLPTQPIATTRSAAQTAGEQGLASAYQRYEGTRQAGRQAAQRRYATYESAITHPNNKVPKGELTLKPEVIGPDGEVLAEAVKNLEDWNSPVSTAPFKEELAGLIQRDTASPFRAGSPIRKFLDALGENKGYDYIEFDTLKKAVGKLSTFARTEGPATPDQRLARIIVEKINPILRQELKKIAVRAAPTEKTPAQAIRSVKQSMEGGNVEWAKYKESFSRRKKAPALSKAQQVYSGQRVGTTGKTGGIQPTPGVRSVRAAASAIEPIEESATASASVAKVAKAKADEDWMKYYTKDATNLDTLSSVMGPDAPKQVLSHVIDYIYNNNKWDSWKKINPEVIRRLTAHDPKLGRHLTSIFDNMARYQKELEKLKASRPAGAPPVKVSLPEIPEPEGLLHRVVHRIQQSHRSRLERTFTPKSATVIADAVSLFLRDPKRAALLDAAIKAEIPRAIRRARRIGTTLQAAPAGIPLRELQKEETER